MINIAICDDCRSDLQQLRELITEILETYAVSYQIQEYDSGNKLLETALMFHIIFLDIMLEGENGIKIGQQIYQKNRTVKIIFQTNFGQYCNDAINKCHAFAFLEKPLEKSVLEEQIREFLENREGITAAEIVFEKVKYITEGRTEEKPVVRIPVGDIFYFEYQKRQKQIKIVTGSGHYLYCDTMSRLEERMKCFGFELCCRGILINIEKVRKVQEYQVFLRTGEIFPLSQRRAVKFKERINEYIHDSFQ